MQVSVEVAAEEAQYVESLSQSQEKSACEILSEKLRIEYEDQQRAIKELDDLLEPAIIEAKNGKFSNETPDEIFKGVLEKITQVKH